MEKEDNIQKNSTLKKNKVWKFVSAVVGLLAVFFIIYGIGAAFSYLGYGVMRRVQPATVYFATGSGPSEQAVALKESGAVKDTLEYLNYIGKMSLDTMPAGKYVIKEKITYKELLRKLSLGEQTPVNMTFTASRTLEQVARKLSSNIERDSAEIADALFSDSTAFHYGFRPETFKAMLIPNTYQVYWNISTGEILDRLNSEYEKFWKREDRDQKREQLGLSREEVSTLASIVYEESKVPEDMRKVAGVYLNRLRIGMRLQADPTAKYATGDWTITRVLHAHTRIDSPYNTYRVAGLPPGPIVVPSIAAIDAVLNYEKSNDLYFCAAPEFDGTHRFAPNLTEHNKNVRAFRKAYQERERERKLQNNQ